ncbi:MAG: hypothetical protein HRU09_09860 [Oligoflexales bacterium]|nr:hypothetical protein [Oligoflexales bacterium]
MHRILDVKPEHEAIIVDRIEAYVLKALERQFPQNSNVASPKKRQFAFSHEESTLITEPGSLAEESLSSNPEKKLDAVTKAVNEVVSEVAKEAESQAAKKATEKLEETSKPEAKVLPLTPRETKKNQKSESNQSKKEPEKKKRRSKDVKKERQVPPAMKTFLPRKFSNPQNFNLLTLVLVALLVLALSVLLYLIFA